jgi:hypothetical protein
MSRRLFVALALVVSGAVSASPAAAQERVRLDLSSAFSNTVVPPGVLTSVGQLPVTFRQDFTRPERSRLMTSLYATTAVMQALDVHSTMSALSRGAVEANPAMGGITRNKAAFVALKAGVAVSTVLAARNMSKRNKVAAALTLVAVNSAYAFVVSHNYRVARNQR